MAQFGSPLVISPMEPFSDVNIVRPAASSRLSQSLPVEAQYTNIPASNVLSRTGRQLPPINVTPITTGFSTDTSFSQLNEIESKWDNIMLIMFEASGVTGDKIPIEQLITTDAQLTLLREIGYDQEKISSEFQKARKFFETRFGIDPEKFKPSDGKWKLDNHLFYPYIFKDSLDYHVHYPMINERSMKFPIKDTGYIIIIGDPGMIVYGAFGGEYGRYLQPGSIMMYGIMKIRYPNGDKILHYRSDAPFKSCIQRPYHPKFEIFDAVKTATTNKDVWGYGIGSSATFTEGDGFRIAGRNVVTFPGYYHGA